MRLVSRALNDGDTGELLCAPMLYNEKRPDALPAVEAGAHHRSLCTSTVRLLSG